MTDTPPAPTVHGTHDHADDPRNAQVLVNVNRRLVPRRQAVVSVFDAGFVLGDGVLEGLRRNPQPDPDEDVDEAEHDDRRGGHAA